MRIGEKFINFLCRREEGNVVMTTALLIIPLVTFIGAAVDFSRVFTANRSVQSALDAALLTSALSTPTDFVTREDIARNSFEKNLQNLKLNASPQLAEFTEVNGRINATAKISLPTNFLTVVGIHKLDRSIRASVNASAKDAEVVMVLDFSDSMITNDKYIRMKEAAQKLIDTLSENGTKTNVKFGMVPFAAMVHADLPPEAIRSDVTYDGCTQDREYPFNITDETPGIDDATKWGKMRSTHLCADMAAANLKTIPLTNDVAGIKSSVDLMMPYMWTHIALGAEFGWHLLSPNEPFTEGVSYDDNKTIKILILLSDGMQTAPGLGVSGIDTAEQGVENLQSICTGMKSNNIRVYTIGYDLYDTNTLNSLQSCAGAQGKFFDAKDINLGLDTVFSSIAQEVKAAMLRISR